jgi:hypothetical protein
VDKYIRKIGISAEDYSFNFKAYGYNAVLAGPVPEGTLPPREIGMLLTVTAKTQDMATQIAKVFNPFLLHFPADYDGSSRVQEQLPSFAFPFSHCEALTRIAQCGKRVLIDVICQISVTIMAS